MTALELIDITISRGDPPSLIVEEVSMYVQYGEICCILGPSGCGKTTLLDSIAHLIPIDTGAVVLHPKTENSLPPVIGYAFQSAPVLPWASALSNLLLPTRTKAGISTSDMRHAAELAELFGLTNHLDKLPSELSGGMRQRLSLARTLLTNPELLLIDEPLNGSEYSLRLKLESEIRSWVVTGNRSCILVTHDIDQAVALSDRVLVTSSSPMKIHEEVIVKRSESEILSTDRTDGWFVESYSLLLDLLKYHE